MIPDKTEPTISLQWTLIHEDQILTNKTILQVGPKWTWGDLRFVRTLVLRTCCALTRLSTAPPCSDSWNAAFEDIWRHNMGIWRHNIGIWRNNIRIWRHNIVSDITISSMTSWDGMLCHMWCHMWRVEFCDVICVSDITISSVISQYRQWPHSIVCDVIYDTICDEWHSVMSYVTIRQKIRFLMLFYPLLTKMVCDVTYTF